ncbi:MAG: pyruvate kinase [Anaerolineae bacterium]|nr:pyruvate kinase [Anaerolineae bacterium]
MPLTKIVCTLGPATDEPEMIREMIRAGMTVARLNFSHGNAEEKRAMTALVRRMAAQENVHIAIMGDLQGPKIRVGQLPANGVQLKEGAEVILTAGSVSTPQSEIPFPHPDLVEDIHAGDRLLLDDGAMELLVTNVEPPRIQCRVITGGMLSSHKGVNLPGVKLNIPALTDKDFADALLALELQLDYLALSFVRRAADVDDLRQFLMHHGAIPQQREVGQDPNLIPGLVAKIEKPEALDDLDAIVRASDAVMVARGDLGVETTPERVPMAQKTIIRLCNILGKPVITATQMLQSMIDAPRPTRAEASDVANAILDGSDAVMLSGETSIGKYPLETVRMMAKIAETVEASETFPYHQLLDAEPGPAIMGRALISHAISQATVRLSGATHARAILTSTESGRTARMVARHRPKPPLLGVTPFETTARRMQMIWGVIPTVVIPFFHTDEMIETLVQAAVRQGYARVGSRVVLTAGIPLDVHGVTNMVKVHTVREDDIV